MSFETPAGIIEQVTPIKEFVELTAISNAQYILGIQNITTGNGSKITFGNLINSIISANSDNRLVKGTDNKLFVSKPVEIGTLSNLTTTAKDNLVSAINELDSDIETINNTTIGDLNNLHTVVKTSIVNSINELADIAEPELITINNSKAMETGSISDNITIYNDIHSYAHSTYDSSMVTIYGLPIVTDDGVMYGAGIGNNAAFKCGLVDYTQPNFVISCGFIMDDDTSVGRALIGYAVSNYSWGIIINGSIVRGFLSSDGTSWDIGVLTGTTTLVSGHHYVVYLVRENGQKYILYLLDKTTSTLTKEAEITSSADIHNTNETIAHVGRLSGWNSVAPTIDLKEISFNFGSSVINANKTGLDVIKDDNYTVVGSPTISTDGIMSNMSASSYASFTTGITVSKSNQLKIKARITTASSFSKNGRFVGCGINLFFGHTAAGALSVSFLGTNIPTSISLQPSTMYDCEFIYDGTYLSGSATNVLTGETRTSNKVEVTSANTVTLNGYIGNDTANTNSYLIGSLDLNSIEIYIDGNLIYQPCLKIPYNISKTGSKVVDVYARNRVVSMYEQFGYAPYYTINEANQNFTLPMGEVYGMMKQCQNEAPKVKAYGYVPVGTITNTNGVLSGFSIGNFANINQIFELSGKWTLNLKFRTGSSVADEQEIISDGTNTFELGILNGKWEIEVPTGSGQVGTYTVLPNTTYYIRLSHTNTAYILEYSLDGINYTTDITYTSSYKIPNKYVLHLGIDYDLPGQPFLGSIDLNYCNLTIENILVWQGIEPIENRYANDNRPAVIINTYNNGLDTIREWSDGWCEQSGWAYTTNGYATVALLKPYVDISYRRYVSQSFTATVSSYTSADIISSDSPQKNSFRILSSDNADGAISTPICWRTEGYIK